MTPESKDTPGQPFLPVLIRLICVPGFLMWNWSSPQKETNIHAFLPDFSSTVVRVAAYSVWKVPWQQFFWTFWFYSGGIALHSSKRKVKPIIITKKMSALTQLVFKPSGNIIPNNCRLLSYFQMHMEHFPKLTISYAIKQVLIHYAL